MERDRIDALFLMKPANLAYLTAASEGWITHDTPLSFLWAAVESREKASCA
jgi:hypothetical protein